MKVNNYMAILRNLKNIIEADVSKEHLEKVWKAIENPEAVKRSKQLPFRYLSAYKQVQAIAGSRGLDALEAAVEASIDNIPRLPGTTVIAVDTSGSMSSPISANSSITCVEVGMMLGLIANKVCENSHFFTFDTAIKAFGLSSRAGILETCTRYAHAGGGTNMDLPFDVMVKDHIMADRIIILSDNECNRGGSWYSRRTVQQNADRYREWINPDLWVHAIDLLGYGTQQFNGPKTNIVTGWSEKVFNFIALSEMGEGTLEKTIASYDWRQPKAA